MDHAALEKIFFLKTITKLKKSGAKMVDVPDHTDDVEDEADALDSD